MDHHGIGVFLHLREVDVQLVVNLAVTGIVHVGDLLGTADVHLGHLETAEARRLREQAEGAKGKGKGHKQSFHAQ